MEQHTWIDKATEAVKGRRWLDAESLARGHLEDEPNSVEALQMVAQCLSNTARNVEAADTLKVLLELSPSHRPARLSFAQLSWQLQRYHECAEQCVMLLQGQPDSGHLWNSLGLCHLAMGQPTEAVECLKRASDLQPEVLAFKLNLAKAYEKQNTQDMAARAYRSGLVLHPGSEDCLLGLAKVSFALGNADEAQTAIDRLAEQRALTIEELLLRCDILLLSERADEALAILGNVIDSNPGHAGAHLLRAIAYQQMGKHEQSVDELKAAIEIDPEFPSPYLHLVKSRRVDKTDRALIDTMVRLTNNTDRRPVDIALIHFALGKAFDDLEDYEQAMSHFDKGHQILGKLQGEKFSRDDMRQTIEGLIGAFTKAVWEQGLIPPSDSALPLFIVGLQRSGTTLTETILSSHPKVRAGGEISFWDKEGPRILGVGNRLINRGLASEIANRYLVKLRGVSADAERVTDKLPSNFQYVGLLHALFPNARFVHCRRHPVDNCLSFYMNMLGGTNFLHDKGNIVFAYRQYARLMDHWRSVLPVGIMFELDYEELIADQEGVTRRLIAFCGLEWDDSCLHPERNDRMISTASHWQARQPLYNSSLERWRNYEPWLGEFRDLLDASPPR